MHQRLIEEAPLILSIRIAGKHACAIGERDIALQLAFIRESLTVTRGRTGAMLIHDRSH